MRVLKRGAYKFDRDSRDRFLRKYMQTGLVYQSCRAAGVSEECVRHYTRDNIEGFGDEYAEAKGIYRDSLEEEIHRRAVFGVEEPIIGGKDRNEIVVNVTKYSDRLLEFHAKRHIPEYREKQQIDLNVKGGIIALGAPAASIEDWEEANAEVMAPSVAERIVDANKRKSESDEGGET